MGDQGRGWGRPCPECRVRGCAVAALGEKARLEPPDGSGRGPRKWRRPLVGTAQSSGAAPSLWRPPGAVGRRRRCQVGRQCDGPGRRDVKRWCRVGGRPAQLAGGVVVKSGGKATARGGKTSSDGAVSAGARCCGAPPPQARRGSARSGLRSEARRGERGGGGRRERS